MTQDVVPPGTDGTQPRHIDARVAEWSRRRTSSADDWAVADLRERKRATTVSVVIPARDEEDTIGPIVRSIAEDLGGSVGLVDELLVVDSRSTDATAAVARDNGARVVAEQDVLPTLPPQRGKGEALWKGLAASSGDIVVFVDGDLLEFTSTYVTGLLGPLLDDDSVAYVKGFYHRRLDTEAAPVGDGGGRVTELVARPLLNMHWPELAGFVQPLAGEYAGRRSVLEAIPFVTHYGVELAHLVDLLELVGLDALAQVDLGQRRHRHQDLAALGRMSAQIMLTAHDLLTGHGRLVASSPPSTALTQFQRRPGRQARDVVRTEQAVHRRPPLRTLMRGR